MSFWKINRNLYTHKKNADNPEGKTIVAGTLTCWRPHADEVSVVADAALAVGQQAGRAVVVHGQRGLTLALLLAVEHVTDQLAAAVAHTQLGAVLLAAVLAGRRLQTVVLPEQTERARVLVTAVEMLVNTIPLKSAQGF